MNSMKRPGLGSLALLPNGPKSLKNTENGKPKTVF
jgi:hypothetical protein